MRKYFGTDGIRGRVGREPVTPEFVLRLGWAAGRVLAKHGKGPVLIGKDTRVSGYMFESALEAGLSAAGVDIRLLGPLPSPGIAFLTQNTRAQAGIVISASHNPYEDNGIKFFAADGSKLADDVELEIEQELEKPMCIVESAKLGKARRINDAPRRYIEFCKSRLPGDVDLSGLKVVVDCAHGAAYRVAPSVFDELGAQLSAIGTVPDGFNINQGVGATAPACLQEKVVETGADIGLALDGDGDRLILVDCHGAVLDGDDALYIIAKSTAGGLNGAVVGTVMSNLGLELALNGLGLEFLRTNVGDRCIMAMLHQRNLKLGGESSGHIINLNLANAGDGIITALQVLEAMVRMALPLHELKAGMEKLPQRLVNLVLTEKVDLLAFPELEDFVKDAESQLGSQGRVLLRMSGTEPVLRVMVEGEDETQVDAVLGNLEHQVRTVLDGRY